MTSSPTTNASGHKWTEKEVDSLMFRLLTRAYKNDGNVARFIIKHLREELLRELT